MKRLYLVCLPTHESLLVLAQGRLLDNIHPTYLKPKSIYTHSLIMDYGDQIVNFSTMLIIQCSIQNCQSNNVSFQQSHPSYDRCFVIRTVQYIEIVNSSTMLSIIRYDASQSMMQYIKIVNFQQSHPSYDRCFVIRMMQYINIVNSSTFLSIIRLMLYNR